MSVSGVAVGRKVELPSGEQRLPSSSDLKSGPEEAPPPGSSAFGSLSPDHVDRLERLLHQLDARSTEIVPYGYYSRTPPAAAEGLNKSFVVGALIVFWLSSLALGVAYFRPGMPASTIADRGPAGGALVIPSAPDLQEQKVANSVEQLAGALISSSQRLNELEAAVERSNKNLQRLESNSSRGRTGRMKAGPAPVAEAQAESNIIGPLPKAWHQVVNLKPVEGAVAQKDAAGNVEYWTVPTGPSKLPARVLSIGTSAEGVLVHNLEDSKDYTLTPTGEWRALSGQLGGN